MLRKIRKNTSRATFLSFFSSSSEGDFILGFEFFIYVQK